jgi:hypothetical protein
MREPEPLRGLTEDRPHLRDMFPEPRDDFGVPFRELGRPSAKIPADEQLADLSVLERLEDRVRLGRADQALLFA